MTLTFQAFCRNLFAVTLASAAALAHSQAVQTKKTAGDQAESGIRIIEEIVVTASRREQNIQQAATSITALSGDDLRDRSVQNLEDITFLIPGVQVSSYQGDTSIFIRGIGTPVIIAGNDSSTATYLDGAYLSRAAASGPAFLDIERIEVLRGPQGTLYGRNATGGSVNIITKRPTEEFEAEVRVTAGNFDRTKFFGAVSGSIADGIRGRIAYQQEDRSGYTTVRLPRGSVPDSLQNPSFDAEDKDEFSIRASLEIDLSPSAMLTLMGDYHKADDRSRVFQFASNGYGEELGAAWYDTREGAQTQAYFGILNTARVAESGSRDIFSATPYFNETEVWGATAILDLGIGEYDLQVIANHKDTNPRFQNSFDTSDVYNTFYLRSEDHQQTSLDFQVTSPQIGRLSWILGGGYITEENDVTNNVFGDFWEPILTQGLLDLQAAGIIPAFPISIPQTPLCCDLGLNGEQETEAYNVYFDTKFDFTDRLTLNIGVRYTEEKRDGAQAFNLTFLPATPGGERIVFAPNTSLFPNAVSNGRDGVVPDPFGFVVAPVNGPSTFDAFTPKVSLEWVVNEQLFMYLQAQRGFKSGGYNIGSSQRDPFQPEKIWSYEAGFKSNMMGNRVRLNAAAFFYDYENLQAQDSIANQPIIRNVGEAEVFGVEIEVAAIVNEYFSFDAALTYLDAEYTEGVLTEPLRPAPLTEAPGSIETDLAGNRLTRAPEWKLNVGAQLSLQGPFGGELISRVDYAWQDEIFFTVFNLEAGSQASYGVLKARISYATADGRYEVSAFGDNLTDEKYFTNQILTGTVYGAQFVGSLGAPRTYGVEFSAKF